MIDTPEHDAPAKILSLEATSFADRLIARYVAGRASIEELLEEEIDAPTVMRAMFIARRDAARAPADPKLAGKCQALAELFETLRSEALRSPEMSRWAGTITHTYRKRQQEVVDLVQAKGGFLTWKTLPDRVQTLEPLGITNLVNARKMLAFGRTFHTALFPSAQFLPAGHIVLGLAEVANALGTRERLAVIAFLFRPDPAIGGRVPVDLLRQGSMQDVVSLARDRF